MKKSKAYIAWANMKQRCQDKNHPQFRNYGGRGIKVCDSWQIFTNFLRDMGEPTNKDLTLDRINNNKGYSKENCRWTDYKTQNNNKSVNNNISFDDLCKTAQEWAEFLRISPKFYNAFALRLHKGESLTMAACSPKRRTGPRPK